MGGTCCSTDSCPTHNGQNITKICLCQSCLEPLCDLCIQPHNNIHAKLGYPSQIKPYNKVKGQYKKNIKNRYKPKQEKIVQQLAPTSTIIKQFTREYFQRGNKNPRAAKILENLQLWKTISQDPQTNRRISQFFKQNLRTNNQIVGNDYSHLY